MTRTHPPSDPVGPQPRGSEEPTARGNGGPIEFLGTDPAVLEVLDLVREVADTNATILILGETGTGKDLIARIIHRLSRRRAAQLVSVNCGAIVDTLVESELFGHVRGAFTGAFSRRVGRFEAAHGGTLFLDEIAEATRPFQTKLLRILQSGEYTPVGATHSLFCDVRVIAASNRPLRPMVDSGQLREDLFYRLNVIRLEIPPLRQRRGDIPPLTDHFLRLHGAAYGRFSLRISPEARAVLAAYPFPGNVRELENLVLRAVVLCRGDSIEPRDLPPELRMAAGGADDADAGLPAGLPARIGNAPLHDPSRRFHQARAEVVEHFERDFLAASLRQCGGIVKRAARLAGLSERNFHVKLRKYGLDSKSFRPAGAAG